jgi:ribulose-5-phosphate 4-epimerase/fuculose-1-phosphate aldolase
MENTIKIDQELAQAVWVAHALFDRGKTTGTTANISFINENRIYISCSGSCFGTLVTEDFVSVDLVDIGNIKKTSGKRPSKELELHKILYQSSDNIRAVIHVHGPYSVLWSCLTREDSRDAIPCYTPYLDMKLGRVVSVPYERPGSEELFSAFRKRIGPERGYLLRNHGSIVGGTSIMNAFDAIEELEQSAFLACTLKILKP